MRKATTKLDFIKRKDINNSKVNTDDPSMMTFSVDILISEKSWIFFLQKIEIKEINISSLVFC